MRLSASCSRTFQVLSCALALATATTAGARVLLTQEQALHLAFGDAKVERQARFLTDAQLARARELAGVAVESALVTRYAATRDGRPAGVAYFDTHVVRTLPETVMIVVDPQGKIARIEIVSFGEPEDYLPRPRWLEQFPGRGLDHDLAIRRGVHGITGATLSAQAVTDASRRVLAVHRVLEEAPSPKKENAP